MQESVNCISKALVSKFFRLWGCRVSVTTTRLYGRTVNTAIGNMQVNRHGCIPIRFCLQNKAEGQPQFAYP